MKKILLIFLFFIQITLFSQEKLEGNYCTIPIGESDVISFDFKENNRFLFKISGCLGTYKYGVGDFKINDSILILSFDDSDKEFNSEIEIFENQSIYKDSIFHKFKFIDENGDHMMGVKLNGESGEFEFHENYSDPNGIIVFKYLKNKEIENYKIERLGYEYFQFKIESGKSYDILIKLALPKPAWIIGEKIKYSFERIDDNNIKLQGEKYQLRK